MCGKTANLHISLDGNRVVHVDDDALPVVRKGAVDFTDSGERQTEYTYNSDGALTGDANRGIARIDYDACGYPRRVQFMDGSVTEYVYTVTGMKLRTVHRTAVPGISAAFGQTRELTEGETLSADSTDYLGNLILEDGGPSKFLFEGGYCSFDSDGISYHYYDRDHQGNIRAVVPPGQHPRRCQFRRNRRADNELLSLRHSLQRQHRSEPRPPALQVQRQGVRVDARPQRLRLRREVLRPPAAGVGQDGPAVREVLPCKPIRILRKRSGESC